MIWRLQRNSRRSLATPHAASALLFVNPIVAAALENTMDVATPLHHASASRLYITPLHHLADQLASNRCTPLTQIKAVAGTLKD